MPKTFQGPIAIGRISRSTHTAAVHRLVRDGHAKIEEFEQAIWTDQQKILDTQKNFAFVSAGQSNWLDLIRPLACTWNGFDSKNLKPENVGPVTRWFRTNTFYRKPTVNEKISATGFELNENLPKLKENGIVFLLGPYSFSKLVENTHYSDITQLACDYIQGVSKNISNLKKSGYSAVLFLEPYIGYSLSQQKEIDYNLIQEPLKKFDSSEFTTGVHFAKANAGKILKEIEETKINFVGIDALYTQPGDVSTSKDILFGILDGSRAGIENKNLVQKQLNLFLKNSTFSGNYYLGPNDRLWDVPLDIALEKLKLLNTWNVKIK
ncbi:MAG: hypothetical protein Q7S92_01785 [Candidatus Diapherotrites archaeon]|nr:hypothetical protein [Candidatus Diapherotrites archaeon]